MADEAKTVDFVRSLGCALFFLTWAGFGWVSIIANPTLRNDLASGLGSGPALMPILVLSVVTLGGLALAVRPGLAALKGKLEYVRPHLPDWRPVGVLLSAALFPLAMSVAGYQAVTFIFVFAWTFIFGKSEATGRLTAFFVPLLAAAIVTLVIAVGFERIIGARLP